MYSSVVNQLKATHDIVEPTPAKRKIYGNVNNEGLPAVPPRNHPPIPKPRNITNGPALQADNLKTECDKTTSCLPHTEKNHLNLQLNVSGGPKSLPIEFPPDLVAVLSGIPVAEVTPLNQSANESHAPHVGWTIPAPSQAPIRRHSVPNRSMPSEPDNSTVSCFNLTSIFGTARKKATTAFQTVKKKCETSPRLTRPSTVPEEQHYAVSSELLRELTTAEPSSSNGRYIVGKELLSELLASADAPPAPSAPPMDLYA